MRYTVTRDGQDVSPAFATEDEAYAWLQRHQSASADWAMRHEGYGIRERVAPARKVVMRVELTLDETPGDFSSLFREYLQNPEAPFLTDYGTDAWGGYDGPRVVDVKVTSEES